ncbi:MAG: hydrolase [Proteobacteria bacterium]|nr:hydrolase [Pseudomonadota bacterium]
MWKPNTTVAALIERSGRFLLVEERIDGELKLNQPAGHVDQGESIEYACVREGLEETGYHIRPTALVGVYQWTPPERAHMTYLRFAFAAEVIGEEAGYQLDAGIERPVWLTYEEIVARRDQHRSPLLLACIDDYLAGRRFPLDVIRDFDRA